MRERDAMKPRLFLESRHRLVPEVGREISAAFIQSSECGHVGTWPCFNCCAAVTRLLYKFTAVWKVLCRF